MRNFLLLITFLISAALGHAQVAVVVNSPASIAGAKLFGVGQFGADLASGTWTADAALVDDGAGANPNDGCETYLNPGDIAGKIALIDRGNCEFGFKCLAAQNAGAIGAIILNNVAGGVVQDMGPGAVGAQVTIPCVLISLEDGAAIKAELQNGAVNITMGAIVFENNISIDDAKVLNPSLGTVPIFEVGNGMFEFTPGARVVNRGLNDAENTILQATIEHNGSDVYSESGAIDLIASGDTSDLLTLPIYEPPAETGYYNISYEATFDSADESDFDNASTSSFYISENVFSKAQWDEANHRPVRTNAYSRAGGGNQLFFSGFHMTNSNGVTLDSVQFYISASSNDGTFANWQPGSNLAVYAYLWEDLSGDGALSSDEFTTVAFNVVDVDPNASELWLNVPLLDFQTFDGPYTFTSDDVNIFVGLRFEGADTVFFGFDESLDHTLRVDNLAQTDLELPYIQTNAWDVDSGVPSSFGLFNNGMNGTFLASLSTALYVTTPFSNGIQEPLLENVTMKIYPNPAFDRFTTEVELPIVSSFLEYSMLDASGRLLFKTKKENVQIDKAEFNVSSLPVGQYFLTIRTENGVSSYPVSVHR